MYLVIDNHLECTTPHFTHFRVYKLQNNDAFVMTARV